MLYFKDTEYLPCPCGIDPELGNLQCSFCDIWWHTFCLGITDKESDAYFKYSDLQYRCPYCTIEVFKGNLSSKIKEKTKEKNTKKNKPNSNCNNTPNPKEQDSRQTSNCASIPEVDNKTEVGKRVIIVDNIQNPSKFKNRASILKEIKRCKPKLEVEFAYALPAGGVSLQLNPKENIEEALKNWPTDSFQSNISVHRPRAYQNSQTVFAYNIDTKLTEEDIKQHIDPEFEVKRLYKRHSGGIPLPVIKVSGPRLKAADILKNGITIKQKNHICKAQKTPNLSGATTARHLDTSEKSVQNQEFVKTAEKHTKITHNLTNAINLLIVLIVTIIIQHQVTLAQLTDSDLNIYTTETQSPILTMKILQFNSRSLNTSQHKLHDYIQFKGFDILCITEGVLQS